MQLKPCLTMTKLEQVDQIPGVNESTPGSSISGIGIGSPIVNANFVHNADDKRALDVSKGNEACRNQQELQVPDARCWNSKYKLLVSFSAICSYFVITLATSIYIASIPGIMREFHVGETLAISPITFYAIGFIIGPMCTSALSEEFGRQYIYKLSLFLHLIFTIVGGSAPNFRTLAVARGICGIVGSPCVTVFSGLLNDLWRMPEDKLGGVLFAIYGIMGAVATEVGPIAGEAIVTDRDWRWTFWLTAMLVGVCFLAMVSIPETYRPEVRRKMLKLPRRNLWHCLAPAIARPIQMLLMEPIIFPTAAIVTMGQVVVFVFYASYPLVLARVYQFTSYETGLAFIPLVIGSLLALPIISIVMKRRDKLSDPKPEDSLPAASIAGILLPISLFWLAWTARVSIHWICPLIAGGLYGLAFALSQLVYPLYKNEVYGAEFGASSFAVDVAMRYTILICLPSIHHSNGQPYWV
ncbi:MFS general substrate transporter [Penicillium nucicola]|uniref:MFS general substrate transporter n=1 Tax=Penicillium nucicola TaxID=1850975 RepID=UPI0025456BD3|nr:MFS general substrate transporter [Penicillium nucicola]KAJ5756906.1 MFS general substrate transporter [Penicillium nucicola]